MSVAYGLIVVNVVAMAMSFNNASTAWRDRVAHGAAMSWLLMNILWMMSEEDKVYEMPSTVFMCIGVVLILALLMMDGGLSRFMGRFRMK